MKLNESFEPELVAKLQRGAVILGLMMSIVGALTLLLDTRTGLILMGIGALLIFWIRPSRN